MELYAMIALAALAGWIAWKVGGPRVQLVIRWGEGQLRVVGPVSSHQKRELQEFFASQFPQATDLQVKVLAPPPSAASRPRIRIRGVSQPGDQQQIRNFLTSLL